MKCIDEEIPFEIPQGWEWCRLGNIGIAETGTTPPKTHPEYFGRTIPFIGPANILEDRIYCITQGLSEEGKQYGRIVPTNSILQVCIGGSIGKCAINKQPITFNQQINSITPIFCDSAYVHLVLQSETFRLWIMDKATGTATPIINRSNWESLFFPCPPLNEQKRIVCKYLSVKYLIDKYKLTQEDLDNLNRSLRIKIQKSILQEAIQGKLVPQITEEGTAQELLEQIMFEKQKLVKEGKLKRSILNNSIIYKGDDNKYWEKKDKTEKDITDEIPFEIPDSWAWVRHNDLFDISGGSQPPKSKFIEREKKGYIRLFQIRDYGPNPQPIYIPLSTASKISQKGDILLARYGASLGKVFYAEYGAYNVALAKVIPLYESPLIFPKYIYLYYCSSIYQNEIVNRSRCAQAGFNKEDLNSLLFPLPPLAEQCRIVEMYEKAIASIMRG